MGRGKTVGDRSNLSSKTCSNPLLTKNYALDCPVVSTTLWTLQPEIRSLCPAFAGSPLASRPRFETLGQLAMVAIPFQPSIFSHALPHPSRPHCDHRRRRRERLSPCP